MEVLELIVEAGAIEGALIHALVIGQSKQDSVLDRAGEHHTLFQA